MNGTLIHGVARKTPKTAHTATLTKLADLSQVNREDGFTTAI